MPAITLNPGFVLILCALLLFVTPTRLRLPLTILASGVALWLLLDRNFGAAGVVAQIGLPVVLLNLDALNQVFGIAFIAATMLLAIYAGARRHAFEDSAILLLGGGAVSALFVGDLISFVAAAELAGLAAVWTLFASPLRRASAAGARLLIWCGLEGLLFLIGVAFHLSAGAANTAFTRLDAHTLGGGFIFAALLIRVGAPGAHVWLKDAVSHASSVGGAAIAVFSPMLGVYALARLFPGDVLLPPIGEAMIVIGAIFAVADDDLRRAAGYALTAQLGVCLVLIGIPSPLAQADVSAHAFTIIIAFLLLLLALGMALMRTDATRASDLSGVARQMPVTTAFLVLAALAVAGLPWLAPYASLALALEALAQAEQQWLWLLVSGLCAAMASGFAMRIAIGASRPSSDRAELREAPFQMLLGAGLALFLCIAVGLAPAWLYALTPTTALNFDPFAPDRLAPQIELIGAGGAAYLLLVAFRAVPSERPVRLLDLDALYRGPAAAAGRWIGVVLIRVYGGWGAAWRRLWLRAGDAFSAWAARCDRPYLEQWAGVAHFAAIAAVLAIILLARL
ncbi:MAG TPA: proton-conducting transporter membrane subunit [Caulobacterales bacterium]|nr:proton-conducting transporter membrane subunit [Caulobacterales bacterium]